MTARDQRAPKAAVNKSVDFWLRIFFLLPAIESVVCLVLVFGSPSEGSNVWLLGLSPARWLLATVLFGALLFFSLLSWLGWRGDPKWRAVSNWLIALTENRSLYPIVIGVSLLLSALAFLLILLTFKFTDQFIHIWLQRAFPVVVLVFLLCIQNLIILPQIKHGLQRTKPKAPSFAWKQTLIAFGLLVLAAVFVFLTRLGLEPDRVGWDNPGVPILGTQIFLAWLLGIVIYGSVSFVARRFSWNISRIDLGICFLLWLLAAWSWQSQPLTPTFFSPTPGAPNNEFYPYSDAATHDLGAQNLIIGNGFPDVLEKPLYSLFLAGLHTIVGQDYQQVVNAQILVLAFFPAILFLLGSKLHHRFSGLLLALLVVFREANAIALSGEIRVSHSKLLMTDLPAALGIALLTALIMRWLEAGRAEYRWSILAGGGIGLLALLRSQTIVFLPALLLVAFLRGDQVLRKRFAQAGLILLGFILAIFPWLYRNYQVTGVFGYSQPLQALYLAKQYSLTPEIAEEVPESTPVSDSSSGFSKVLQFTLSHPREVAGFVSAHFFHNEVSSLLALPTRFDLADKLVTFYNLRPYWVGLETRLWAQCCSLDSYVGGAPYWQNWDGIFPDGVWLVVLVNLGLISIGIGAAWKKVGWIALAPVAIHLFYNASTAIARVSGWRLILPADWVLILFYCLGIGQVSLWVWDYLKGAQPQQRRAAAQKSQRPSSAGKRQTLLPLGAAIFFIGLLVPLSEIIIPARFQKMSAESAQHIWDASALAAETDLDIAEFLTQPSAEILTGVAMYPRFYPADAGEPGGQWSAFNPQPYSRMAFWLVGPTGWQVALPLQATPAEFPNAVEVLVIGCEKDAYFQASAVMFMDSSAPDLLSSTGDPFLCGE